MATVSCAAWLMPLPGAALHTLEVPESQDAVMQTVLPMRLEALTSKYCPKLIPDTVTLSDAELMALLSFTKLTTGPAMQ